MRIPRTASHTIGGIYGWIAAIYFGAVVLDVVYSGLLGSSTGPGVEAVFSEVADFLLLLSGFTFFMGLLAIGFSWNVPTARNLFAVSLLVIVFPGFLASLVLIPLSRTAPESAILEYTSLFRLIPLGLGSLIGLLGFRSLAGVQPDKPPGG
jgi:hypothetical protein